MVTHGVHRNNYSTTIPGALAIPGTLTIPLETVQLVASVPLFQQGCHEGRDVSCAVRCVDRLPGAEAIRGVQLEMRVSLRVHLLLPPLLFRPKRVGVTGLNGFRPFDGRKCCIQMQFLQIKPKRQKVRCQWVHPTPLYVPSPKGKEGGLGFRNPDFVHAAAFLASHLGHAREEKVDETFWSEFRDA